MAATSRQSVARQPLLLLLLSPLLALFLAPLGAHGRKGEDAQNQLASGELEAESESELDAAAGTQAELEHLEMAEAYGEAEAATHDDPLEYHIIEEQGALPTNYMEIEQIETDTASSHAAMKVMDTDEDGMATLSEILEYVSETATAQPEIADRLVEAFRKVDTDNDEKLTQEELERMINTFEHDVEEDEDFGEQPAEI
eukprot:TRINITY_DN34471_c0_g1_i1.p1 TRINITY_DN34471_c0_g1~~TRINITY_DN34471_c0_g1_i1.p1  ORF type:complete len:225 (+),score=56.41 TRINITY_DN34471_c0_g1_i1:80-676(+)